MQFRPVRFDLLDRPYYHQDGVSAVAKTVVNFAAKNKKQKLVSEGKKNFFKTLRSSRSINAIFRLVMTSSPTNLPNVPYFVFAVAVVRKT